jgi:hypothetical protein
MEVSGQLHAHAALLSEKQFRVRIVYEAGRDPEPVGTLLSLAPAEHRIPAVHSVTYRYMH